MPYSNKWITLELERQLLVDESWAECCPESMRFETEHHTVYSFVQFKAPPCEKLEQHHCPFLHDEP